MVYGENIDMIRVAYWNNTEVTEVTGSNRKRIEVLMHRTWGNLANMAWIKSGIFMAAERDVSGKFESFMCRTYRGISAFPRWLTL